MYLDHRQEHTDRAEYGPRWCHARDFLREIQGLDGHIQQRESTVLPLRSLGLWIHREAVWHAAVRKDPNTGQPFCLVRTLQFDEAGFERDRIGAFMLSNFYVWHTRSTGRTLRFAIDALCAARGASSKPSSAKHTLSISHL